MCFVRVCRGLSNAERSHQSLAWREATGKHPDATTWILALVETENSRTHTWLMFIMLISIVHPICARGVYTPQFTPPTFNHFDFGNLWGILWNHMGKLRMALRRWNHHLFGYIYIYIYRSLSINMGFIGHSYSCAVARLIGQSLHWRAWQRCWSSASTSDPTLPSTPGNTATRRGMYASLPRGNWARYNTRTETCLNLHAHARL
jgi:hypothetical protein